jgi:hypothetical protein
MPVCVCPARFGWQEYACLVRDDVAFEVKEGKGVQCRVKVSQESTTLRNRVPPESLTL